VVERKTRVPDRVPQALGHGADVLATAVQKHEVDVAVRAQLPSSQAADGEKSDPWLVAQQLDEPRLDEGGMGPAKDAAGELAVGEELAPTVQLEGDLRRRRGPSRRCGYA
jgi:hypothetical protein